MSKKITQELLSWFRKNKRDLPWRKTSDPYVIWLSEIIFQQTRISQGIDYYQRFVETYPDIFSLSAASEDDVLKLWQGLGYYSRARNMLKTAQQIVSEYNGVFPSEFNDLIKLKGIGDYTASVILSVCFHKPYAVIDGNVNRLISRLFSIHDFIDTPSGQLKIRQMVDMLIDIRHPGDFNEAMMDFGAMICTPQNPGCFDCVLKKFCSAYTNGSVNQLPAKSPKRENRKRDFHYFLIRTKNGILLKQRSEKDIWHNLFDLPMIEFNHGDQLQKNTIIEYLGCKIKKLKLLQVIKHKLTHQELTIYFYNTITDIKPEGFTEAIIPDISNFAVPKPIENFLKSIFQLPE
jgi:A/G-specific adenine glycosylase